MWGNREEQNGVSTCIVPASLSLPDGKSVPMRIRSMVGLIPLYACAIMDDEVLQKMPGFRKRMIMFLKNRKDLTKQVRYDNDEVREQVKKVLSSLCTLHLVQISYLDTVDTGEFFHLLAIPSKERLLRVLTYMLDENEFLSDYGLRSMSKV